MSVYCAEKGGRSMSLKQIEDGVNNFGYKSTVDIIMGEFKTKQDETIIEAIQEVGINVDKEELIKALNYDRNQYEEGKIDGVKEFIFKLIVQKQKNGVSECNVSWSDIKEVAEEMGVKFE
jgi:hypothetical protein